MSSHSSIQPSVIHPSQSVVTERWRSFLMEKMWAGIVQFWESLRCVFGQHSWKVRLGYKPDFHCLGVSPKPLSPKRENDQETLACCWKSRWGHRYFRDGVQVDGKLSNWHGNDTLQLDLDCDCHTLRITNLRSGESSTFSKPPGRRVLLLRQHAESRQCC